jgi:hypothetical protein
MPGWVRPSFEKLTRRWPEIPMRLDVADSHAKTTLARARKSGPYALIHIDGDHSYEGALADLRDYSPLLIPTGRLVVDGVHWDETVFQALETFLQEDKDWQAEIVDSFGFGDDAVLRRKRLTGRVYGRRIAAAARSCSMSSSIIRSNENWVARARPAAASSVRSDGSSVRRSAARRSAG